MAQSVDKKRGVQAICDTRCPTNRQPTSKQSASRSSPTMCR
uniref:Predicted protein n=1 Tax=Hordeum vulgare subsp. vulgare TaxID=112509 RepID=F2DDS2_HORVV|nr:predicted protein [Hordeum vulgare subsp. vulgare]